MSLNISEKSQVAVKSGRGPHDDDHVETPCGGTDYSLHSQVQHGTRSLHLHVLRGVSTPHFCSLAPERRASAGSLELVWQRQQRRSRPSHAHAWMLLRTHAAIVINQQQDTCCRREIRACCGYQDAAESGYPPCRRSSRSRQGVFSEMRRSERTLCWIVEALHSRMPTGWPRSLAISI